MNLPFTLEQFLEVFRNYNQVVFPTQVVLYLVSGVAIYFVMRPATTSDRVISFILAAFWLWMGVVYHLIFFTGINKAAYIFGMLFIVQGLLFFVFGVLKCKLSFKFQFNTRGIIGLTLILFSLLVYPILGYRMGHVYPESPTFGLPCPTTIFTFGILLFADKRIPFYLLIVPIAWSAIGFAAAFSLGIKEDIGLAVAGLVFTVLILFRGRHLKGVDFFKKDYIWRKV